MTNLASESWYIVKQPSEECKIISAEALLAKEEENVTEENMAETESTAASAKKLPEKWGPFETQHQAIAKRVGLIRAGKCKPS